jgi:hydroxymethylbilane synthase
VILRIATRGSALALVQAAMVRDALATHGADAELVIVETAGDRRAPDAAWGEGAFVAAIEQALLDGHADVAVHSAKDVPIDGDPRLVIAAYLAREDPRDALVVRADVPADSVTTLPRGAVVGTDSPRRGAFLRAIRPDLVIRPIHGNVDTRLRRLDAGEADALVLAVAGLARLGRADRVTQPLDPTVVPPAPGQGAIAVQTRVADATTRAAVARLDDAPTRRAVEAERAFLEACGGGCRAPVGALATVADDGTLRMVGGLADGGGRVVVDDGDEAGPVGLAALLSDRLAPDGAPRIAVTRAEGQATPLVRELAVRGLASARVPAIAIEPSSDGAVSVALSDLAPGSWVVVTSANGAQAIERPRDDLRWAAVGPGTTSALARIGVPAAWMPSRPDAATLAEELPVEAGSACLLVRGDRADASLPERLAARGAHVREVVAYRTIEGPPRSRAALADALADGLDALAFASGSAVRGLLALAERFGAAAELRRLPALCFGGSTAAVAREAGFAMVLVADEPTDASLADLAAAVVAVPA